MLWFFGALGTLGFGGAVIYRTMVRPVLELIGRTNEFFDDWFGTEDRPGVPGRAGVMVRLSEVEIGKADRREIADLVQIITEKADKHEVQALRDALDAHIQAIDRMQEETE